MINFPDWSDLGLGHIQDTTRMAWDYELSRCLRREYYFDGLVFEEKVDVEQSSNDETPLMFPVGMNLVKMLTIAQADSTFGEWEEQPVRFIVRDGTTPEDKHNTAIDLAYTIMENSNARSMLWEHDLDRQVYGGGAIKIQTDFQKPGHIKWVRVPRGSFFPVWDPDEPDELLEAYLVVGMTPEQAKAKYNYTAENTINGIVRRVEHWTRTSYENRIEEQVIPAYSGHNPWGIIPFVYTPRLRFNNYYGDALTDDIVPVQDDLNMRVADIGEAINYNSHPTRWGMNLPRDFNAENFPLGPNAFWNIGRAIGNSPEPKVGILEAENAITPAAFDYVKFIYDWSRTSVFSPPIAFGEDSGGGQRSGVTLEIRMWPLIKATRRSRGYLGTSLKKALQLSAVILQQKEFEDVSKMALRSIINGEIIPDFHPMMPRDQAALVDEVVKLLSTTPPSISLDTALNILGRGSGEKQGIRDMLGEKELWEKPVPTPEQGGGTSTTPVSNS